MTPIRCIVCNKQITPSRLKEFKKMGFGVKTCSKECSHANTSTKRKLYSKEHKEEINKNRRINYHLKKVTSIYKYNNI
ncbi:MAG: hypothetical protein M0R17_05960 [Candidatus Omnitrophica bacterium]|jgi:hypothetical protein|nr:hypothetical protein [Candidatus Omnitrophota bacterium]